MPLVDPTPVEQLRASAVAALDNPGTPIWLLMRAVVVAVVKRDNALVQKHNDLLTWLAAQTSLTNRAALDGFALPLATAGQVRQAIKDEINAGAADV